jgi:hypothetical protein
LLPLFFQNLSYAGQGKDKMPSGDQIEIADFPRPSGKRCEFIGVFEFDSISGDHDAKAREVVEKKVGRYRSGGQSANYLLRLGTEGKTGGFPPGGTLTHHYSAYYCFNPLNK